MKKDELVTRCVDGELFGAWPRCPLCKKGRTRLEYDNPRDLSHGGQGNWSCPGYSVGWGDTRPTYANPGPIPGNRRNTV